MAVWSNLLRRYNLITLNLANTVIEEQWKFHNHTEKSKHFNLICLSKLNFKNNRVKHGIIIRESGTCTHITSCKCAQDKVLKLWFTNFLLSLSWEEAQLYKIYSLVCNDFQVNLIIKLQFICACLIARVLRKVFTELTLITVYR